MWLNPITEITYTDKEMYIRSLIDSYLKIKIDQHNSNRLELLLVDAFTELATLVAPDVRKGKTVLMGGDKTVEIERKLNANYPKQRGAEHPLRKLMGMYDDLGKMVRVEYKESGKQIQELVDRFRAGTLKPTDNADLAQSLLKIREEKQAKPTIKIKDVELPTKERGTLNGSQATDLF